MEASLDNIVDNTHNLYQKAFDIMMINQPVERVWHSLHNDWDAVANYERGMSIASEFNDQDNVKYYRDRMLAVCPKIFDANRLDRHYNPDNEDK